MGTMKTKENNHGWHPYNAKAASVSVGVAK
jgi:hypothetical protein